ncbi:MAG TPA: trypsin-like serine protease [Myxococcota bacterium]|nr:trypsin-like serine protease [Myxococcota bacterium]HRY94765.1 trypsin-like serine protease [Myxococcota bacterium]HSA22597.1 trypsin-like serine protease [Myxococcota bacterium]
MPSGRALDLLPAALALALACAGCGPADPRLAPHEGRIIYGSLDTDPAHAAVVAVTSASSLCSGTLIAPRVVLTAAHCAEGMQAADMQIHFGNNLRTATAVDVEALLVHPAYVPLSGQDPSQNDLALLRLAGPPPEGVVPIPNLPGHMGLTEPDLGVALEFVGFGEDEFGVTGLKLSGVNSLQWLCVEPHGCTIVLGATAPPNSLCYDERPAGPCSGDSGGPALLMRGNLEFVAGATSFGDESCRYYGCSTKVDAFQAWIDEFAAGSLGAACAADGDCLGGVCARGVCCAEACPGACSSCGVPGYAGSCRRLPDGAACGDGDPCTGEESCLAGVCLESGPPACDDGLACTRDSCRAMFGCEHQPMTEGEACGDDDVCNGAETCRGGVCLADAPLVCQDADPCTLDLCDPVAGCQHPLAEDGAACESARCGPGTCQAGVCAPTEPPACDQGGPCAPGHCEPDQGCVFEALADGTPCGPCMLCQGSLCVAEEGCTLETGCGCGAPGAGPGGLGVCLALGLWLRSRRTRR